MAGVSGKRPIGIVFYNNWSSLPLVPAEIDMFDFRISLQGGLFFLCLAFLGFGVVICKDIR